MTTSFPNPTGGASLLLSFKFESNAILILGSSNLAASRAFAALEANATVIILAYGGYNLCCDELRWRSDQAQLTIVDWDALPADSSNESRDVDALESYLMLQNTPNFRIACITDTSTGTVKRSRANAEKLYQLFRSRNIPVNTTDMPALCDFSFTSSHRFIDEETGKPSPLQVGVTTNGMGCRLAGRLRRDIVSHLPKEAAIATTKVGQMRIMNAASADNLTAVDDEASYDDSGVSTPNRPVPQRSYSETRYEQSRRRMKWIAQVSEYWSLKNLSALSSSDMKSILAGEHYTSPSTPINDLTSHSLHGLEIAPKGKIFLVGSGPGHPGLLTIATRTVLTEMADLVLSDKLVPEAILAIIPSHVEVRIARKFPGNADGAQNEMMEMAVDAANSGKAVVRLKQGDPVVYGRAGEEVLYFRSHGFESVVIPGVSSAIAAPTMAGIPVTQRGAAESFIVCTGVGRKGKEVSLPGYERSRTLIMLMGVARLSQIISTLVDPDIEFWRRKGDAYPANTPIALIERASMPDQRVLLSTLKDIVQALESLGEQRPPGMFAVGWAVISLYGEGDVEMLGDNASADDEKRVQIWLGQGNSWRVKEGLDDGWASLA